MLRSENAIFLFSKNIRDQRTFDLEDFFTCRRSENSFLGDIFVLRRSENAYFGYLEDQPEIKEHLFDDPQDRSEIRS